MVNKARLCWWGDDLKFPKWDSNQWPPPSAHILTEIGSRPFGRGRFIMLKKKFVNLKFILWGYLTELCLYILEKTDSLSLYEQLGICLKVITLLFTQVFVYFGLLESERTVHASAYYFFSGFVVEKKCTRLLKMHSQMSDLFWQKTWACLKKASLT